MRPTLRTLTAGLAAAALAIAMILWEPAAVLSARERATDLVSRMGPSPLAPQIVVVEIDEAAVAAIGPWPWPRQQTAELIRAIASAKPAAMGLDIVLSGRCGVADPGNADLAEAIAGAPISLGSAVPGPDTSPPALATLAVRPGVSLPGLWRSDGIELPCPEFIAGAEGLSVLSLAGDSAALVRTVPALVAAGSEMLPGLAVDVLRLSQDAGSLLVSGSRDPVLAAGAVEAPIGTDAEIRFRASAPADWAQRTMSARDALRDPARLEGRIVLIGASLPQLGALRPTAATPLAPSTQIMADTISGLLTGRAPWRPAIAPLIETIAVLIGAAAAILALLRLRPVPGALAAAAAAGSATAGAAVLHHLWSLAFDPLFPALGIAAAGLAAGLSQFQATRAAEAAIRTSFEQRLPPAVVARLAAGGALRMEREERVVTALFTDIEGFSRLTSEAGPQALVALLDGYYDGVTRIVTGHGGMVDKIVGDAVHAFFNMPLPLDRHEERALSCAEAIIAFTEDYRKRASVAQHGFGRTRIGIETGPAIIGDVGAAGKFDYSAHGASVNLAARLQDANKRTGTAILVGAGIRAAGPAGWDFETRGSLDLAGFGPVEVFTPKRSK